MATVTKEPAASQQATSSSAEVPPEDESLKRNTDCVYFLASPLTCKKGSECEYRHSEYARVNPRDCWYWLNGNCLNPKCSFRHPPLDGLVGPQVGNFSAPSLPPPMPLPISSTPHNPKQPVLCIFFQKGYCLKGDRCPFSHGHNPPNTKIQPIPATTPSTETPTFKKSFGGLEKCSQPKIIFQANAPKVVEGPPKVNPIPKVETSLPRDGVPGGKHIPPPNRSIEVPPKYKETTATYIDNGNSRGRATRAHHGSSLDDDDFQNRRETEDSLRESSPGFDVLVDDKLRGDEYYHDEDHYARMSGHDQRNLDEFEMGHNSAADVDPEIYHNRHGYDPYDRIQERYAREPHRASLERSFDERAHHDRKGLHKSESPEFIQNSDQQKRVNGLRSVVNPDYNHDNHAEDRGYRSSQRDSRRSSRHESSTGSRLQGRIKLPRRSPPAVNGSNMYSERENERRRPPIASHQGRLRDRLSGIQDDLNDRRDPRGPLIRRDFVQDNGTNLGPLIRRDFVQDNGTNFAGPKSLAELKGTKQINKSVSGGKLRDTVLASSLGTESDLSFKGPKPLSEILKRKRDTGMGDSTAGNKEESKQSEINKNQAVEEEYKSLIAEGDEEEGEISNKKSKFEGESSISNDIKNPDIEEGLLGAEGEEHELDEEYDHDQDQDQGDVEYEYEQDDGEGYNLNEDENPEHEEDFMDEDDGDDDFAKKIGVSF